MSMANEQAAAVVAYAHDECKKTGIYPDIDRVRELGWTDVTPEQLRRMAGCRPPVEDSP